MKRLVCELLDISKYRFQVAYSVGFATGLTAILANVVLTLNHHYKYKRARHLVVIYFLKTLWHSISEQSLSCSCCTIVLWGYGFIDFRCDRFQYREKYKVLKCIVIINKWKIFKEYSRHVDSRNIMTYLIIYLFAWIRRIDGTIWECWLESAR